MTAISATQVFGLHEAGVIAEMVGLSDLIWKAAQRMSRVMWFACLYGNANAVIDSVLRFVIRIPSMTGVECLYPGPPVGVFGAMQRLLKRSVYAGRSER